MHSLSQYSSYRGTERTRMNCLVIFVAALVALAASEPITRFNRKTLNVVSNAVNFGSPGVVAGASDLSRNSVLPESARSDHKRVRRTVLGDGNKCSTGKIRLGKNCVSCALLERQNPNACKRHKPQQFTSNSTSNRDSDISTSTKFNTDTIKFTISTTCFPITTGMLDSTVLTEVHGTQSTPHSINASLTINLAKNGLCYIAFAHLILYIFMYNEFI